jgi:hypothetical protein
MGVAPLAQAATPAGDSGSARDTAPSEPMQPGTGLTPIAPLIAPAGTMARRPLMGLMDSIGIGQQLDKAGIQVYGHAEASYTYNFANPPTSLADYKLPVGKFIDNPGRVFDVENQDVLLNQFTINVERRIDASKKQWDVGGRVEFLYGADARFIHANGMMDNHDDDATVRITGGPQNQFDIPNLYADIAVPVGNGLNIRVGKFTYFKQIDPNASVFYSHSFTFGGALPFTLTGIYGSYVIQKGLTVEGGISRGWDQSLRDNNDTIDIFGRVRWDVNDKLQLSAAFITGAEQDDDNGNWRTAIDVTASYQVNKDLLVLGDVVYGQQAQGAGGSGTAAWYGVSVYGVYTLCEAASLGVRLEYYADDAGYTTGLSQNLYEATVGLTITPFPKDRYLRNLKIRPEVRVDYSDKNYFDGFDSHYQITAAIDAIYNF